MEVAKAFTQFAHELRSIEADSPYDGERYLTGICSTAAMLVNECHENGVLTFPGSERKPSSRAIKESRPDTPSPWYDVWFAIASNLQSLHPTRLPANIAVTRAVFHARGPMKSSAIAKAIDKINHSIISDKSDLPADSTFTSSIFSPRDWKQRARNYALVCELLAELVGIPKTPQEQCDAWLISEWDRGVLTLKALLAELHRKPIEWQGDIATIDGLRTRLGKAYTRAKRQQPKRKNGRPKKTV